MDEKDLKMVDVAERRLETFFDGQPGTILGDRQFYAVVIGMPSHPLCVEVALRRLTEPSQ